MAADVMENQLLRLGKGTLIYGLGEVVNRFLGFLLLPLFTAYLTPKDYGISSILNWIAFFLTPVFSLGIGAAMAPVYFGGSEPEHRTAVVWTAFFLLLGSGAVLALLAVFFPTPISSLAFNTEEYRDLVSLSLWTTFFSILIVPFTLYFQFEEKAKWYVSFNIVTSLVFIVLSVLLVVLWGRGIRGWVEAGLVARIASFALFASFPVRSLRFHFRSDLCRSLLSLGIPLIPSFAFLFVLQQGNRYILELYQGLNAVGIYTIGFNFGLVMNMFISALATAWTPFFMSYVDRQSEARELFGRVLTYYVIGFGALVVLFFIAARPVTILLTQEAFHGAYRAIGLTAGAYFFIGFFNLLLPAVYYSKEVRYVTLVQGAAAALSVPVNLLLIPSMGLLGAALSLMIGNAIMAFLLYLWNLRRRGQYFSPVYEWPRIGRALILYAAISGFLIFDRDWSFPAELLTSGAGLVLLFLSLWTALTKAEQRRVGSFILAMKRNIYGPC